MMEKKNVPAIRFSEFTDEWKQLKIRNISDRFDNLRVPITANLRVSGTTPYYGANGIQDYVEGYTHEGEFVLVAEDGANDLKNYPVRCVTGRIWVNNHAHVLQGKPEIANNQFLSYAISQADIECLLVGGSRTKLNAETLMDMDLILPEMNEQKKVGGFFTDLDGLIVLNRDKYGKLQSIKKAMLEKMFPHDGASVPEVRFNGFTGEWTLKKMDDVVSPYLDPVPTPHDGYWRLGIRSHAKGVFHDYVKPGMELETAKMHRVAANNFIVNITFGWEHAVAITSEEDAGMLVSHRFPQFSFNQDMVPEFFKYVITDKKFRRHLELASPGGAGRNRVLNIPQMLEYKMYVPSRPEQERIAGFFLELDSLISLQQQRLEKLKNIKSACLEKMFV